MSVVPFKATCSLHGGTMAAVAKVPFTSDEFFRLPAAAKAPFIPQIGHYVPSLDPDRRLPLCGTCVELLARNTGPVDLERIASIERRRHAGMVLYRAYDRTGQLLNYSSAQVAFTAFRIMLADREVEWGNWRSEGRGSVALLAVNPLRGLTTALFGRGGIPFAVSLN